MENEYSNLMDGVGKRVVIESVFRAYCFIRRGFFFFNDWLARCHLK